MTTLEILISSQVHKKGITELVWSYDSFLLLTSSDDGTLKLCRATDLFEIITLYGHFSYVTCCDIAHSSTRAASGSYDESVRIWELATGLCLKVISAHEGPVSSVHFSSNDEFLVSCSWDCKIRIWEVFYRFMFKNNQSVFVLNFFL